MSYRVREIEFIAAENIVVQDRLRHVDPEKVNALAASIGEIGLQTPLSVRIVPELEVGGQVMVEVPVLIAGANRLAAIRQLGWENAPCYVLPADDVMARLWEIDENLCRSELTPAQVSEHLALRRALSDLKNGKFAPSGPVAETGDRTSATSQT